MNYLKPMFTDGMGTPSLELPFAQLAEDPGARKPSTAEPQTAKAVTSQVGASTTMNSTCYEDVVKTVGPAVWRVLRRMGVPVRAVEDAGQDVFLIAHHKWDSFRGDSSRRAWILGIAMGVAANYRRRYARVGEEAALMRSDCIDLQPAGGMRSPHEMAELREASDQLQELLGELKPLECGLWVLVYLEDLTIAEAAQLVDLPRRRAYGVLGRAQKKLALALQRKQASDEWRIR